jgi:hypothetical protein
VSDIQPTTPPRQKPKRYKWRSLIFAFIIFFSGVIIGSGFTLHFLWERIIDNFQNPDNWHERLINHAKRRLDLTEEQVEQIKVILQNHKKRFRVIREEFEIKLVTELQTVHDDIDEILTPEQSEKWNQWITNFHRNWLKPFTEFHQTNHSPPSTQEEPQPN